MDDRNEEVFQQYDIKINNTYRARGALLLDTDKGLLLYGRSDSSNQRLEYENSIKHHIQESGYEQVDIYLANRENALISMDKTGAAFTIKHWFQGEECNLRDLNSSKKAAENLGKLHKAMRGFQPIDKEVNISGYRTLSLSELFRKRNRELKRVRSYILDKKQKNEFEILFLQTFDIFYKHGLEAERLLSESSYNKMLQEAKVQGIVYHGSYNQHNILFTRKGIATTNFDKADIGIQIIDLYQFLRKAMEKNSWNLSYGMDILDSYLKQVPDADVQIPILYILMKYPEKFWKITNHYYNNKKSWISGRNIQKLSNIKEQETNRMMFLKKLESNW